MITRLGIAPHAGDRIQDKAASNQILVTSDAGGTNFRGIK
jgi:hypothetical protein